MASLENTADLMESADHQRKLISDKLNQIIRESVDISSLTLADPTVLSHLKEMDDRLQAEMRKLSEQSTEEERRGPAATSPSSLCQPLHDRSGPLEQLRHQLEDVQSAARALHHFLSIVREVRAEIPKRDPCGQENEADGEQERRAWQAAMQRLQAAAEQSDAVDRSLKAAGMTLTVDGAAVTCQDVVKSLSKQLVEVEKTAMKGRTKTREDELLLLEKRKTQEHEELNPLEIDVFRDDSPQQSGTQACSTPGGTEEESGSEAKKRRVKGENDTKTQREDQTRRPEGDVSKTKSQGRRRRSSQVKKEAKEKESLVQRRAALLAALRQTKGTAEQLRLQEPTLPALQQRRRALTELESALAGLLHEVQYIQGASSRPGLPDEGRTREVDDLWEETTKAVTDRLEQCRVLTELLKRFQGVRGELSGTLQRAESTISEQASYMGKDNLQRLHTQVQETKAELNVLGDDIEEVRSVCRQLHSHLRQIPGCNSVPFESEADALMDRWLDLSERTDSHLENLRRGLSLWDGVLQLGTEVESWTDSKLAVFAQRPSFESEEDIKALQDEIVTQEEIIKRFQQRTTEIQVLLQSTEPPLELQVVETHMKKKMEQLKELVAEAEDVYEQLVAAKGQITGRMAECFNSLQKIQDSLHTLSGRDVSTVLAKLKELCLQLRVQDEQAESLLEDVGVMASIAGPESFHSLSADGIQLQEKVRNAHQLFSEVEEQTKRNIQDLDRLQMEAEHLEQWLHAAEEKAAKETHVRFLQEEALQQSARTSLLSQLLSSLRSSSLQKSPLLEESRELLGRYHDFHADALGGSKETRCSPSRDIEGFHALSEATQSWVGDLRQIVDSPLDERFGVQNPAGQRLHCAQVLLRATTEAEARLEELRVAGDSLSCRLQRGDDLKRDVKERVQKAVEQWRELLQSAEPYYRTLKADPELASSYSARRQEACCKVEDLQHRTDRLPTFFPWPGTAERTQASLLARQLQEESESLQSILSGLAEQRRELAERTGDTIWKDSSRAEPDGRWSALMAELKAACSRLEEGASNEEHVAQLLQDCHHKLTSLQERMSVCQSQTESSAGLSSDVAALEALLQEVSNIGKDVLQLATLKDSIAVSSTAEAQASLTKQVSSLQNHKRALESSIRDNLTLLTANHNQRTQQVKGEASCLQTALKDLADNVNNLSGIHEVLPDISQLKQQWRTIQDLDTRLTELAARVNDLQTTTESNITQEKHADVFLAVHADFKDLGSLRSILAQKKQECADITATRVRELISRLQRWSQTARAEPSSPSQAALDEGLQLQQALHEVLSEQDFLLNCLGTEVAKKLEKSASGALGESQPALESLSKCLVSHDRSGVQLENRNLLSRRDEESLRSEGEASQSAPADDTTTTCPPASPFSSATDIKKKSENDDYDDKIRAKGIFRSLEKSHPSTEPVTDTSEGSTVEADATKQDPACTSMPKENISVTCTASSLMEIKEEDALAPIQVPHSENPDVFRSKMQQQSQQLTSTPPKMNLKTFLRSTDDSGTMSTDINPQSSTPRTSGNNTRPLISDSLPQSLLAQQGNTVPLQRDTTSAWVSQQSATDNNTEINSAQCVSSLIGSPDNLPLSFLENASEHPPAQSETFKDITAAQEQLKHREDIGLTAKKVFTVVLDVEPQGMQQRGNAGVCSLDVLGCFQEAELYDAKITQSIGFPEKKAGLFTTSLSPESDERDSGPQSEILDAQEPQKCCEDVSGSPDEVLTRVLDMELQPKKIQQSQYDGASCPDVLRCSQEAEFSDAKLTEVSSTGFPEKKPGFFTALISPESAETDLKSHYLSSESNPTVLVKAKLQDVKPTSAKLQCKENLKAHESKPNEVSTSSTSRDTVAGFQLTGSHAAGTTSQDVQQEEGTDFCPHEERPVSSGGCTVEDSVQTEEALTETQISASDNKQVTAADAAHSATCEETAKRENTEEANDSECVESEHSKVPEIRNNALLLKEENGRRLPAEPEDTAGTQRQHQIRGGMEPERTAPGLSADLGAGDPTGGSSKHGSTTQGILSESQSLVESSNIINRTMDLSWYLKSSPGEPEIRLVRTVQQVLACRYQPAQLSVTATVKQLEEAQEFSRRVQEQVATMKNMSTTGVCDPNTLTCAEGQWSAALLDASATVQVKATQLDQVKLYHRQMKITRAFLEVIGAEKEKMSSNALGSSALQAEKLNALLQTMEQKKDIMKDLLCFSSQLSVHLSDAESSGALLAQLGDVQEEWRLLEGSIKRALRHASNSSCQSSLLLKEAEQLKAKLDALQKFNCQSLDGKSALEFVCLTTDLKLYNQLYLHLQFQSDALINFSLGQKEKKEIERNLRGLESLLAVTKRKFDSFTSGCGVNFSTKINKHLQDLIVWAKQAENHIIIGEKLALFPEEARIQIVEMKKFQTDILRRRSKMRVQVEEMKNVVSDMEMEDGGQVLKTVEDLYGAISDSLDHILDTMKKNLNDRENLLCGLANMDAWLAETHAERDPCTHVENVSGANIGKLESELKSHKLATVEIENQLKLLEAMLESCRKIATGLSPGESRYLVNRLSGLWTELDGLLAQEKATSWELEEVIQERTSSDDELSTVKASLKQISSDLEQQKFPLTQETLSTVARLKHMLMEHQCEVQELQHCQEAKRSSLLCSIGELQDRCKTLSINAFEQDKYLHLRRQMEESRDIAKGQIEHAQNKAIGVGERFRLCQTLLVELPLVRTQCQEAADQLEAIAQEIHPTELNSERERIHRTVETLVAWELSVTDDIKNLEAKLLLGLQFNSELPAFIELLQNTREALKGAEPVSPEEKAIDGALRQSWVIWRNMESGMRVLEGLGQKEKLNLRNYKELYSLRDAAMQECHAQMVGLSQARESLKDYQWAAQGALGFLHNAEATFLSAPGGFLDCTEEQRQTQQALEALEDGFQAHICHIVERVPQQTCLSRPKTEQLHIGILSQLQVGRGVLEAQAQLRLESLQRCEISQQNHRKCHEDICQRLSEFEPRLSDCAAEQVTSYDRCVAQQRRAKLLMEELRSLAGRIEDLRAGCPMQGCGVGKDGELGALWRRWVSVRRGVSLLMARTEQRGEEWKDIRTSMEQCCSSLTSLQAEVPDSSTVSFIEEEPQELLTQAEMHQAGLEQEQQALASLEHRLEHALSLSTSHEPVSPGHVGKTLVKIQENVRSLKERNLLVVAAAQAEERDRQQVQEEIGEVERHLFSILPALEASPNTSNTQELRKDLSSQKTKLKCIMDGVQSRYAEIPADIGRVIHEVELSLQRAEEKIMEKNSTVGKLACRVRELGFGLEKVKVLLEQRSPTVSEAQNVLKCVWDELDMWHSSLMVLENEVQDLTDDQPHQVQLLIEQLTQPLQLYQDAARMAEQRTAFLSKIPACLQEFKDILCSATCWLDEAQSWLSAPCSFTTARNLQNHAKSLQLVLEDSERIRHALQDFRPVLAEISVVCDISTQEERLDQDDQQVHEMQCNILEPLEKLLQSAAMVEAMEAELKAVEKNVSKIRTILSSMDVANITLTEHLQNRQVILDNVRSMQRMLKDIEKCKGDLHVPRGAEEGLLVFSRAQLLLQQLEEVAELTQQQASLLENKIMEEGETNEDPGIITVSDRPGETQGPYGFPHRRLVQEVFELSNSNEEEDEEDESYHSSSSDTLTCSIPEDPEETLSLSDVHSENMTEINPEPNVKELQSLVLQFSSKVEMGSKSAETSLLSAEPGFGCENVQAGLITPDSEAHVGKAFSPETATAESVNTSAVTAAEDQFKVAAADQNEPQRPETSDGDARVESPQAAAAVEDTRLIPLRPITPFTAKRLSTELTEEEGEGRSPSAAARSDQALSSNQLSLLDEFEPRRSEMFPSLKDAPSLECAPGRHLRERPGEKAELQRASRSSLRGIARLLQLGEERMRGRQRSRVHSRGQLQAALCRHEKLLQVLRSQLAFVQYLFQNEPEALKCQEDERVQLEIRAKALQQRAVEQEVASQRRLWEWTRWEDNCGRLGRVLDESEAFISCGEPEGDENEEEWVQLRLDACQQTLVRLDESGAALGLLLDQGKELQAQPGFAFPVSQAGGALELRWRSAYRRTEQEIQRCRDIRDRRARFQSDSASVSKWLVGADKHLKVLSGLAETSHLNQECVQSSLIKLLDLSMEVEGMSPLKTSVVKDATRLLHLREADCPELRTQLTQLENSWNQLTSDLSKTQDQLQQRLVAAQPPAELLSDLQDWLKKMEARLNQEKQRLLKATNAAQISEILQQYQVLKAAVANAHLLLDFLCQPGLQAAGGDVQALRSERTAFAEELGVLQLQWLNLQRELESQIHGAEQIHHACAERERRLQGLRSWMEQQKKQLSRWKRPTGRTAARQALPEWEAAVGRAKEAAAAIQELKTRRVHDEKEKEEEEGHPWDVAFFKQAESIGRACEDLSQQLESVRAALQQAVEDWSCFHRTLRDVTLNTTRVRCALQRQQTPLLSLQQAEGYCDLLQQLQVTAGGGEELWPAVDKPLQRLVETLHRGAAQALRDQVEGERKWWKDVVQEIQDEHLKTGKTRSLWQDYTRLSESCSRHQRQVWHQWEELSSSPLSPEHDTQAVVDSVQKLQDDAEELQSSVGNVLAASKHLVGRLEPLAANLIQSETRVLSRDTLLLNQVISGKRKSLQEDLEQKNLYHTRLEAFEKQTQNSLHKLKADIRDADSVKVLSELSDLLPSLVDLREMSDYVGLNNRETERLRTLSREWAEGMTRTADMNRNLQEERQRSQNFQEKCKNLTSVQEKLERESACRKPPSYSSLREMLSVHQRLQAEIVIGHQLLQRLHSDAVESAKKETAEKRCELLTQVARMKESWSNCTALVDQNRTSMKEQLHRWTIYQRGLKLVRKLLRDVDSLLPPAGPSLCTLHQLHSYMEDNKRVEERLDLHSPVYTRTLEAGKHLCETMTESECRSGLQSELQAVEEAWERTTSLLRRRTHLVNTAAQTRSRCQEGITNVTSELDELKLKLLEGPEDSEDKEPLIQETELSLQRLAGGLRELATMKTDLSQYVAASESALLEQQLEQLHGQWEELCMKVSLRRQEVADRVNAWTIFNDKNKEFCDWLTQMENKVCRSGELSIEEMVDKLKKDCMEEINLFSENKSHLKQLGEQLLLASDEAKQTQVYGSLQEVNQRWHHLFHHIESRVKKLKETLVTVQQLDKNMSNLRSWLSRIEAELSRPIKYSVCHEQEIQRRLAEQQELQRDIEQHTEGVASVLSLCDVLLRDEDAGGGTEAESDSLQETSRSLDQRWRTICALALDRRLRIEETWSLWCKFFNDYSQFEDWLKVAERTAASPNSADVLFTVAKEELKKFEGFQRQVHERLTQLELVNNQYRRLARENRTDRASQLKAMVHEGNRRWDTLHRRVAAILRRLKYFTSQREEFEGTRESMVVWLTELDLQLTNVEHFLESDVHHKIQQLNSFQKEITLNTERIDGLIVFGEGLIQKSSQQDAALIEDELEELHSYCQEVFSRLVRFHQRLSQPPMITEEPELSTFSLESSLELIGRPWLGRSQGSLPATPIHLLTSPLERSGRETPVSVDSLPLEWDHTGDVGGSSSHEDDDEEEEDEEEGAYFSAISVSRTSLAAHESPRWPPGDSEEPTESTPILTSTPKPGYLRLMSQCSGSIENLKRVSMILDDEEQPEEFGLTGLTASDKQSGVIERWELLQAQSRNSQPSGPQEPRPLASDLHDIASWLESVIPELDRLQQSEPAGSIEDMEARAKELKEMQKTFSRHKSTMLSVNLRAEEAPQLQDGLTGVNRDWSRACTRLQRWDTNLRRTLMCCQEFQETLHSLLLWLAHAESRRYAVDISHPDTPVRALQQHSNTLTELQEELRGRRAQQASLQALWSQLQPEDGAEESVEAREKLHVTGSKLKTLLRQVDQDLSTLRQRLESSSAVPEQKSSPETSQAAAHSKKGSATQRERRESCPPRSFFSRVLRAAFPLQLLLLFLLLLPCLIPLSETDPSCSVANNFARSFYPMLRYTNGPPPT